MRILASILLLTAPLAALAAIPVDTSGLKPGPVRVESSADVLSVIWTDGESKEWRADFSLDPARPLITSIATGGRKIIERARPMYDCSVGKRRGGLDQFFDFPPSHPDGTRSFTGQFRAASAKAGQRAIASKSPLPGCAWASSPATSPISSIPAAG